MDHQGMPLDYATPPSARAPTSLVVVAVLFILSGAGSALEMLMAILNGGISIQFGVLGLFIGPGLLRFRPGWRTCGLVFIWLGLIMLPIVAVLMATSSSSINFKFFGQNVGSLPRAVGVLGVIAMFVMSAWQYRVLTRPDVRRLFKLQ